MNAVHSPRPERLGVEGAGLDGRPDGEPAGTDAYLPQRPYPTLPRQRLPAGACDSHFHVFEDAYPCAEPRSYTPAPAPMDSYRAVMSALGVDRAVLIQPSVYGRDHRLFESMLAQHGAWMRGVAVVYGDTPDDDIARWDRLGARGARCNALYEGGATLEEMRCVIDRVRAFGWHVQLLVDVARSPRTAIDIADLNVPVVVDHFGHLPVEKGVNDPGFANLVSLVREGRAWVKLSAAYRLTNERRDFSRFQPMVDALLRADAGRLVWGTDWPHPAMRAPMIDDGVLADAVLDWLGPADRQRVLVDNPTALYWRR